MFRTKIEPFLATNNYKTISLYGFIYMFVIIISAAALVDFAIGNDDDAAVESLAVFAMGGLIAFLRRTHDVATTALIVVWLSAAAVFTLVLVNDFHHNTHLFLFFAPFAFYLVLDRERLLRHTPVYYMITVSLLVYGYFYSANRSLFDDTDSLVALGVALAFDIAIGIFIYYAIQYSFDRLEASNDEKELLLREIHHRVKNNLNLISSILGLQNSSGDPEVRRLIARNRERIQSIATVHEMLYRHDSLDAIDCRDYIETITREILLANTEDQKITLRLRIDDVSLPLETMIYFGLMIQEMFVNSLKHAITDEGVIRISLKAQGERLVFEYADDGRGCSDEALGSRESLGSDLIRFAAKKLHADMRIETTPHVHYRLEFGHD